MALTPSRYSSARSSKVIRAMVGAGLAGSLAPSVSPRGPRRSDIVAHRLNEPGAEFPIHAAWRSVPTRNPLLDAILAVAPRPSPARSAQ